jgi:hypothetical protein
MHQRGQEILEKGSKRGGHLLVGSDGFTYGVKVYSICHKKQSRFMINN